MREPVVSVGVVVPAHDEEERVADALASLQDAARQHDLPVTVVVVLDDCSDRTAAIASTFRSDRSVTWMSVATVAGRASIARQVGLTHLRSALEHEAPARRVAVLSTDADSVVPKDWIAHHVRRLDSGDDAVAGVVDLRVRDSTDFSYAEWRREYESGFGPDGTHPHVHAANLSVRLDVLTAAGGFGSLARAEDIDLWQRLQNRTSATLRSDRSIVVHTSHRSVGRVEGGFATAIQRYRRSPDRIEQRPHVELELVIPD